MVKFLAAVSTVAFLGLAGSASADWLVMKDGSRVETQGSWETKGRLLVFNHLDGQLASIRASEVDLEASEAATREAIEAAEEALSKSAAEEPASRGPVLVLTDADVDHVDDIEELDVDGEEEETDSTSSLTVVNWDQEEAADGQGIVVRGTLRNDGTSVATRIEVVVQVSNSEGEIVGTQTAQLTSSNLGVDEILNFRTQFVDIVGFDTARFDISSRGFESSPRRPTSPDDEPASSLDSAQDTDDAVGSDEVE